MKQIITILFALVTLSLTTAAAVSSEIEKTLVLGVLALRPKPDTVARWQPLADYLEKAVEGYKVRLLPLNHNEIQEAIQSKKVDLLLTNPAHFIDLRTKNNLTGALATLVLKERGIPLSSFGGVVFTRSNDSSINSLEELEGRTIACVGTKGVYASYLIQAFELHKIGIDLSEDAQLKITGMPQDLVVEAVLSGKADAGFVRSGMIEELASEGKLKLSDLKVLNKQKNGCYPFLVSTPLYPEWPFVAMPHLPEDVSRMVARALLGIESNSKTAKACNIHGFTIPADYQPVESLLRELRLPPFDAPIRFKISDVWKSYKGWIIAVLSTAAASILLSVQLILSNRRLLLAKTETNRKENYLRTLINAIPDLVWFKDPDGVFIYCNLRFESLLGKREAEIIGKTDYDFVPTELADLFRKNDRRAIEKGGSVINEERLTFACDMHKELLETIRTPIYDSKNQLLGVLGVGRDITGRKMIEEQLTETMLILNESQAIAHLGGWKSNPETDTLIWTDELYRMFEHPKGRPLSHLGCIGYFAPEFQALALQALGDAYKNGAPFKLNCRMISTSGREFWVDFRCIGRLDSEEGQYIGGTMQDITERKQIEELLTTARDMAEAVSRAKTELLATVSHELRTPLNGVMGGVQLLEITELSEEQKEYLKILKQAADNELALVNDLIDLASLEASGFRVKASSFLLLESINAVIEKYAASISEKGLSLELSLSDSLNQKVVGDSPRLRQIFDNLLSNAVKFTGKGRIAISGEVTIGFLGEPRLRLSIIDTGIGISKEDQERIFAPFVQVDMSNTRNFGGTGLGLAICRKLSEMMGGSILLESKKGEGSCFVMELPFERYGGEPSGTEQFLEDGSLSKKPKTEGITVLLAEDNDTNMKAATGLLRKLGVKVITAVDGKQAVAWWMRGGIELILMDIQMPVMDGRVALKFIRQREKETGTRTPVIALTAYAMAGDKERLLAEGFDGYLAKPFKLKELSDKLEQVLSK